VTESPVAKGLLEILREACEGGIPGQGTAFLDGTRDGVNNGLFATLDRVSAEHASSGTFGTSIAAHAAHTAYHMEVVVRWTSGDRGPFDWKGSFEPAVVDDAQWAATRTRLRAGYEGLVTLAHGVKDWNEDETGGLAGAIAHVAYHLGAIRLVAKQFA
jgi:hypothetical protein